MANGSECLGRCEEAGVSESNFGRGIIGVEQVFWSAYSRRITKCGTSHKGQ